MRFLDPALRPVSHKLDTLLRCNNAKYSRMPALSEPNLYLRFQDNCGSKLIDLRVGRCMIMHTFGIPSGDGREAPLQVRSQIVGMFETDRKTQQIGMDACFQLRFGWHAAMSHAGWRAYQGGESAER